MSIETNGNGSPLPPPETPQPRHRWIVRRLHVPVWMVLVMAVLTVGAAVAIAAGQQTADRIAGERDEALIDAQRQSDRAETFKKGQADAKAAERQAVQDQLAAEAAQREAERLRDQAIKDKEMAEADRDAVLAQFDPEIQAAVAKAVASAMTTACEAGAAAGLAGQNEPVVGTVLATLLATVPRVKGQDITKQLDQDALQAELNRCYQDAATRAQLDGPHNDGFYTVGIEISAGKWRSNGTGGSCYWSITPDGNPDNILANHFGNAGGTVTLKAGQEFETDGCGDWTKVG